MLPFALNHMTMPLLSAKALCDVAGALGCVGVELRNDVGDTLFNGISGSCMGAYALLQRQRVLALAEVTAFNADPADKIADVLALSQQARACGADAIILIPEMARAPLDRATQRDRLQNALEILQPILEDEGIKGLIEPLGFARSSLRFKEDVVRVLDNLGRPGCFGLVHDTFHHALTGETAIFADLTDIVHISGVADPAPAIADLTDAHRGLIDADDRLDNIAQLKALIAAGYTGPASFEAFAPSTHALNNPAAAVAGSIAFINAALAEVLQEPA